MSSVAGQTAAAIERHFEVALFLLITTGFLTLAGTGKLDFLSLLLLTSALGARGWLLLRNISFKIPETWTNYLTFLFAIFYIADFFLVSNSFVYATAHLLLLILAVKMFSVQRERDYLYLILLPFLMVLLASILTVDSSFLFIFGAFLLIAVATFITLEMRKSARTTKMVVGYPAAVKLPRWISLLATSFLVGIVLLAGVLFFVLPRRSGGYLSSLAQSNEFVTGFSNSVELGAIGEIKKSNAVVMHIKIPGDTSGQHTDLKWRGMALGLFNGRRWSNQPEYHRMFSDRLGNFNPQQIGQRRSEWVFNPSSENHPSLPLSYTVFLEPIGTDVFFVAPYAVNLRGSFRYIVGDSTGALFAGSNPISTYEATSNISEPSRAELMAAAGEIPAEVAAFYRQLPPLDPRIPALAKQATANATSPYEKAIAIQNYLDSHYGYTLQLPATPPRDPVANFLFERKQGHCEYFASAMALMLRTLGIPARLISGFRGAEFNDVNSTYIVRASSAHTWVEAYIAGYGWVSFDPTPADPKAAQTQWSRLGLYLDAMGEFWREWIVNYDALHQFQLHNEVVARWQASAAGFRDHLRSTYNKLLRSAASAKWRLNTGFIGIAILVLVLVAIALASPRVVRIWRRRAIAASPQRAPQAAASIWYERLLVRLDRRGWTKRATQTPEEFARSIADDRFRAPVETFTEHYERARFGESAEDAEKLAEIYDEIAMLK